MEKLPMSQSHEVEFELLQDIEKTATQRAVKLLDKTAIKLSVKSRMSMFWEIVRFAIVGVANTVIDLLTLNCLLLLFPMQDTTLLVAYNSVAYTVGALNSFVLNKYWTFPGKGTVVKDELPRFILINLCGLACNNVLLWMTARIAHPVMVNAIVWANSSKIFAIAGTSMISFLGMRLWVFAGKTRQRIKKGKNFFLLEADRQARGNAFLTDLSLSVILPAHNEEAIIGQTVNTILTVLTSWLRNFEIIVVNDGSVDNTKTIVEEIAINHPQLRIVSHSVNRGYGAALVSGFNAVTKDLAFFMDSDGQFDIRDLRSFFPLIERYDAVLGYRVNRQDTWMRKLNAWGWKTLVSFVFGIKVRDIDCAFKLYRAEIFRHFALETRGAMINTEILYKMKCYGYTYTQVGVRHLPRTSGKATGAKINVILRAFHELFIYARKWQREDLPKMRSDSEMGVGF
jgi:putative flippase GtrA